MRGHPAIPLFRIFGVPQRVVIFQRLSRRPSTASELARELPVSRSAIVQHLTVLRQHGLVEARTEGRNRIYHARQAGLVPLGEWLMKYGSVQPSPLRNDTSRVK